MAPPFKALIQGPPTPPYLYCSLSNQPGIHGSLQINRILKRGKDTSPVEKLFNWLIFPIILLAEARNLAQDARNLSQDARNLAQDARTTVSVA